MDQERFVESETLASHLSITFPFMATESLEWMREAGGFVLPGSIKRHRQINWRGCQKYWTIYIESSSPTKPLASAATPSALIPSDSVYLWEAPQSPSRRNRSPFVSFVSVNQVKRFLDLVIFEQLGKTVKKLDRNLKVSHNHRPYSQERVFWILWSVLISLWCAPFLWLGGLIVVVIDIARFISRGWRRWWSSG